MAERPGIEAAEIVDHRLGRRAAEPVLRERHRVDDGLVECLAPGGIDLDPGPGLERIERLRGEAPGGRADHRERAEHEDDAEAEGDLEDPVHGVSFQGSGERPGAAGLPAPGAAVTPLAGDDFRAAASSLARGWQHQMEGVKVTSRVPSRPPAHAGYGQARTCGWRRVSARPEP